MTRPRIVVHGGAWNIPDEEVEAHERGCRIAVERGWQVLLAGGSAVDAVEAAVRVMEDDPTFDAGVGAFLNAEGEVELDAAIMDGSTLAAGAVAALRRVRAPVSVARAVMERTQHVLLVGEGAALFAEAQGFERCRTSDLLVGRELERWKAIQQQRGFDVRTVFSGPRPVPSGTVGAVALDLRGNLAAATSTGGTPNKMPGRVGDSPLIGAGTYADNATAAISATGWGEGFIRLVVAKTICDLIECGREPDEAVDEVMHRLETRVGGSGGVILLDRKGRMVVRYNTPRMARAWVDENGQVHSAV
ncbi:MAG: isoaspartyl peptidase/L-asparaginase [candidate division KSB1 bacterium]|nr:isoaspartyl peptidase/L-asparaginase [candidate division KSB1 bacterium]